MLLQLQTIWHKAAAIGSSRIRGLGRLLAAIVLVKIDLARGLGEGLEGTPSLRQRELSGGLAIDLGPALRTVDGSSGGGDAVELEAGSHAVRVGDGWTFLGDVRRQAVDAALGEVLAALLARVRIAVAVVVELRSADEILEDEGIRLSTHCDCARRASIGGARLAV